MAVSGRAVIVMSATASVTVLETVVKTVHDEGYNDGSDDEGGNIHVFVVFLPVLLQL